MSRKGRRQGAQKAASNVPVEKRRFTYGMMRRAAEIGAAHGYYMAYMQFGLKEGEGIDVAVLYDLAVQSVREKIARIEGIGFIQYPEGEPVRMDVRKEIVEMAVSGKNELAGAGSPNKGKRRAGSLKYAVEQLIDIPGITPEQIEEKTKGVKWKGKIRNRVKHKKAVYDVLIKIAPNLLKEKE